MWGKAKLDILEPDARNFSILTTWSKLMIRVLYGQVYCGELSSNLRDI